MGHYWSEVQDDMPTRKRVPREPVDQKERESSGVPSLLDEGSEIQYAIDCDRYSGRRMSDEPETANLIPQRYIMEPIYFAHRDEESKKKFLREVAARRKDGDRPAIIMKRTVTYGPWEVIDTVEKSSEGWY